MNFTKMHGLGNDYIYVNCLKETIEDPEQLSIKVSDRHRGIGSDGLILIKPCESADFEMNIYNADGSRAKMCGNGIRCVGKYVYDYGLTDKTELKILTDSGIRTLYLTVENGKVKTVKVNMGAPILEAAKVPVISEYEQVISKPVTVLGKEYSMTAVSMGNPHCVVPVEDVKDFDMEHIGPVFENLEIFPERVNTEFIRVEDRQHITMRVWERGSAETQACGTGACAVAVACMVNGWTDDEVTVTLLGGDLKITWDRESNIVWMEGPAAVVCDGVWLGE